MVCRWVNNARRFGGPSACTFKGQTIERGGLLLPEDETIKITRNVRNYLPISTALIFEKT
jgi:hypothetical protein